MPHSAACPICGNPRITPNPVYRKRLMPCADIPKQETNTLRVCTRGCGFAWIQDVQSTEALRRAYENTPSEVWQSEDSAARRQFAEKVAHITRIKPSGRVLDVGCFRGDFLRQFPASFERFGLEPSAQARKEAQQHNIQVMEGDVDSAVFPCGHFDVIVAMDVIEHVVDQHHFIRQLQRWLAPAGVLVLETGDRSRWLARAMGPRWYYYAFTEHLAFHTRASLNLLLQQHEMRPILEERRWHQAPPNLAKPLKRAALALGFRLAMTAATPVRQFLGLPKILENLYTHTPPPHASRDHAFHIYQAAA